MLLNKNESGGVRCGNSSGTLVDTTYDLLLLKPTLTPEPGTAPMLIAGCLLLRALRRKRDRDGPMQTKGVCVDAE